MDKIRNPFSTELLSPEPRDRILDPEREFKLPLRLAQNLDRAPQEDQSTEVD